MIIKVDNREKELINQINILLNNNQQYKEINIIIDNLPLGDIIICDEKEEYIIIERKSINDLSSSIKDGRYEEQSYRLNMTNNHNHNIIYVIEGDINKFNRFRDNKTDKMTLYSAIFSLNYYKGFSVIRTFNIEETAIFICNSANKLRKGFLENRKSYYDNLTTIGDKKLYSSNNLTNSIHIINKNLDNNVEDNTDNQDNKDKIEDNTQNDKDYINVIKKIKKENITTENIDEIMLCQIPGISSVTALAIINQFKSISLLIKAIETDENCLNNICYKNNKEQLRKISKTSIQNILKFLIKK